MTAEAIIQQAFAGADVPHLRDRLLSLDDLNELPRVQPLVEGLLYTHTVAQLAGDPGSFKSFIGVGLACAVASGQPWCGHPVTSSGNVVYVAAEGASGLQARVKAWCEANQVPVAQVSSRLWVLDRAVQLGDVVEVLQACDIARETGAALLILDTRARCTLGLAENDATAQGGAVHQLERIKQAAECTVLCLHHSGRNGDHGRGSNAWDAAVWTDLRLKRTKELCTITCEKHKEAPSGCSHAFRVVPHTVSEHLMARYDGETDDAWYKRRSTLVVVQSAPAAESVLDRPSVRIVLDIIWTHAGAHGLTAREIVHFAAGSASRASVNAGVKMLREAGKVRASDVQGPMRYLPAEPPPQA